MKVKSVGANCYLALEAELRRRRQAPVAEGVVERLEVSAPGHVVGGHGVAQTVGRRALDPQPLEAAPTMYWIARRDMGIPTS
jgi:hypothetical protein